MLTQEEIRLAADALRNAWYVDDRFAGFSMSSRKRFKTLEELLAQALTQPSLYDSCITWSNASGIIRAAGVSISASAFSQHYTHRIDLRHNPMVLPLHADPVRSVEAIYNEIISPTTQEVNLEDWL